MPKAQPPAHATASAPTTTPALGQILTEQQKQEYRKAYEQSSEAARRTVTSIARRPLNREQRETVARIESFLRQADEARTNDWSLAAELARRAQLLANDLAANVQ